MKSTTSAIFTRLPVLMDSRAPMPIKLDMIPARLPPACPCSREIPFSPGSCSSFPCYPPCRVLNHLSYYGVLLFSSSPHTALPPGPSTSWVISPRRASADKVSLNFNTRPFPGFVQAIPDHPRIVPLRIFNCRSSPGSALPETSEPFCFRIRQARAPLVSPLGSAIRNFPSTSPRQRRRKAADRRASYRKETSHLAFVRETS